MQKSKHSLWTKGEWTERNRTQRKPLHPRLIRFGPLWRAASCHRNTALRVVKKLSKGVGWAGASESLLGAEKVWVDQSPSKKRKGTPEPGGKPLPNAAALQRPSSALCWQRLTSGRVAKEKGALVWLGCHRAACRGLWSERPRSSCPSPTPSSAPPRFSFPSPHTSSF